MAKLWRSLPSTKLGRRFHSLGGLYGPDSASEMAKMYSPGDKLFGYSVDAVSSVPDLNLVAIQLHHDKTGAQHLHVCRQDSNNCFSVGFPTNPVDSTGVAHILEHTALCGSRRYPVRDPFFKMLTRSLATFMNAFTASDWTMYPFCTQNQKDFYNLLSVYLDSALFPLLHRYDFRQEGWRLEHEDPHDKSSPIVFKGVVYNEMKGVFSSPENIFMQANQNYLFPSHTYSHVSGGLPINILDLTLEQLQTFHAKHYHPTNGHFYTYGDMPLATHLQRIDEEFLSTFERVTKVDKVLPEPRWDRAREQQVYCGVDPMLADAKKCATVGLSFLLAPITYPYESLVQSVISRLLIEGPASPFYQALLDSNIGSDYSPSTGYDNSTYEASFSIGLQGVAEGDVSKVKDVIWKTFEEVASNGFPEERVRAVIHQIELSIKHQSSSFGLSLISSLISPWIHGGNPVGHMHINALLQKFKEDLSSGSFLKDKVREYFLENKHQLTLTMLPDEEYETKLQHQEQEKLDKFVSGLSDSDRSDVYDDGLLLLEEQNKEMSESVSLPTLAIADVKKDTKVVELENHSIGGSALQYSQQPTNGVVYFKALSSISSLPEELKPFIPLFCFVVTRMGAGDLDHQQFAQLCDLCCGGLSASPHIAVQCDNSTHFKQDVLFTSHCVERNLQEMFSLWQKVLTSPNLTSLERLRTLVDMYASNMATSIADSGHLYAMMSSASSLSPAAQLSETFNGMTQVEYLRGLAAKDDLTDVSNSLGSIAKHFINHMQLKCAVNSEKNFSELCGDLQTLIESLPHSDQQSSNEAAAFDPVSQNIYYEMPFSVNYCAQSYITVPYAHVDSPRLQVLARLMGSKYLHREIREKGGAYGSGVRHGEGILTFFSYRDPNSTETLQVFQDAIEWACSGGFSDKDVDEAKLSVFSQIDAPVSPGLRGSSTFLRGITHAMKQQYRDYLFDVKRDQVKSASDRYLKCQLQSSTIIGPKRSLSEDWTIR